jgi:hypothetical protein
MDFMNSCAEPGLTTYWGEGILFDIVYSSSIDYSTFAIMGGVL